MTDQQRAVLIRALTAWTEIALCESWLAQFGPAAETTAHQMEADVANQHVTRIARRLEAEDARS